MRQSLALADAPAPTRPTAGQRDLFDDLWRVLSSPKLALVLMLLIAAASFAGALIVQAPSEVVNNPAVKNAWLAQAARPKFGALTDLLWNLQLFWVFQTPWFRALLGLLTINTIVCTTNRLPAVWQAVFHPVARPHDGFFDFARFGTIATHLALVLVLVFAGIVVAAPLGAFAESAFTVPVGSTRDVGHQTGLSVYVEGDG